MTGILLSSFYSYRRLVVVASFLMSSRSENDGVGVLIVTVMGMMVVSVMNP
jgi:hypothetical protein